MEYSLLCTVKWKKYLVPLCGGSTHDLLCTINFVTLVKEMSLTHYPDADPIDSAKNSEIAFMRSYKNHPFQYDTNFNPPHFLKIEWKKKWELNVGFFSTLHSLALQRKMDRRFPLREEGWEEGRKETLRYVRENFTHSLVFLVEEYLEPFKLNNPTVMIINTIENFLNSSGKSYCLLGNRRFGENHLKICPT